MLHSHLWAVDWQQNIPTCGECQNYISLQLTKREFNFSKELDLCAKATVENWTETGHMWPIQKFELLLNSIVTFFPQRALKNGPSRCYEAKLIHCVLLSLWKDEFIVMKQILHVPAEDVAHQQLQLLQQEKSTYQSADLLLPVGSRAGCSFDHGGCLVVCQFLDAALTCYDVTDLWRRTEELVSEPKISHKCSFLILKTPCSHLQGKISVLLFLPYLQAG